MTGKVVKTISRSTSGMSCHTIWYLHCFTHGAATTRSYVRGAISSSATTGGHFAAWSCRPRSAIRSSPWQSSGELGQMIPCRMFIVTMRRSSFGATLGTLAAAAETTGAATATSTQATSTTSSFRTIPPDGGPYYALTLVSGKTAGAFRQRCAPPSTADRATSRWRTVPSRSSARTTCSSRSVTVGSAAATCTCSWTGGARRTPSAGTSTRGAWSRSGMTSPGGQPGDEVVGGPAQRCGACEYCLAGRPQLCTGRASPGVGEFQGAFADFVRVRDAELLRVPPACRCERRRWPNHSRSRCTA